MHSSRKLLMVSIIALVMIGSGLFIITTRCQSTDDEYEVRWSFSNIQAALDGVMIKYNNTIVGQVSNGQMIWQKTGYSDLQFSMSQPFLSGNVNGEKITIDQANEEATLIGSTIIGNDIVSYYRYRYAIDFAVFTTTPLPSNIIGMTKQYVFPGWSNSILKQSAYHGNTLPTGSNYLLVAEQVAPINQYLSDGGFGTGLPYTDPANSLGSISTPGKWYYQTTIFGIPTTLGKATASHRLQQNYFQGTPYSAIQPTYSDLKTNYEYKTNGLDINAFVAATGIDKNLVITPSIRLTHSPLTVDQIIVDGVTVNAYAAIESTNVKKMDIGNVLNIDMDINEYEAEIRSAPRSNPYLNPTQSEPQPGSQTGVKGDGQATTLSTSMTVTPRPALIPRPYLVSGQSGSVPMFIPGSNQNATSVDQTLSLRSDMPAEVTIRPQIKIQPKYFIDEHEVSGQRQYINYHNPWKYAIWWGPVPIEYMVYPDAPDGDFVSETDTLMVPTGIRLYNQYVLQRFQYNVIIASYVNDVRTNIPTGTGDGLNISMVATGSTASITAPHTGTAKLTTPEKVTTNWEDFLAWLMSPLGIIMTIIMIIVVIAIVFTVFSVLKKGKGGSRKKFSFFKPVTESVNEEKSKSPVSK